ncbi:MAG: type II toxin-antitoxin system HipA family toxin [Betaproteobacteria bacterium]|nr:type II toxin-antitoxin system HipA family toxin [Betaproteobacteria bacterium]MDE2622925.1 type II toxin-antitoxin system HipA family toxin [Betaproteobacteria bacterium]
MVAPVHTAQINLWGRMLGAVTWLEDRGHAVFQYDPEFMGGTLDVSPLRMGLPEARRGPGIFEFSQLAPQTYHGLPGLLADSLPDKFGNAIIDAWLARNGRDPRAFSPVERLCYTGVRGMGALEYQPATSGRFEESVDVDIAGLVELVQEAMAARQALDVSLGSVDHENAEALLDILRVGTSAGGARPKAVIAMNDQGRVISGQADVPPGFDYWILKFDGVSDMELGKPQEFGRIEYAYHLMAQEAGIQMTESRLLEENGRAHFMTRRFDRDRRGKLHMQSLCGIAHYDFNMAGAYGYEQAFQVMRSLGLPKQEALEQYRRMVFNVVARNQDDHTKNIAFLMDPTGQWRLSPAFDVTYSHNPGGKWTSQHQMSIAGKRDGFTRKDLLEVGRSIGLPRDGEGVIDEVCEAVNRWRDFAAHAGLSASATDRIAGQHRLEDISSKPGSATRHLQQKP